MKEFTIDQVWGLAVRADRLNGGYVKEVTSVLIPNKVLLQQWLDEALEPTDEEISVGQQCRNHFTGYTLRALSEEKVNSFQQRVMQILQMESFSDQHRTEIAIVSSLPSAMRREQQQEAYSDDLSRSVKLAGNVGDRISGTFRIASFYAHPEYGKYNVIGKIGDSYVRFWTSSTSISSYLSSDRWKEQQFKITGRIADDRTKSVKLNYVKLKPIESD